MKKLISFKGNKTQKQQHIIQQELSYDQWINFDFSNIIAGEHSVNIDEKTVKLINNTHFESLH